MLKLAGRVVRLAAVALGGVAVMWASAYLLLPDVSGADTERHAETEIAQAIKARNVSFDPNNLPTLHRDIHVEPRRESPILTELVEEGELPPLKQRMPEEPTVMEGPDGIGNYGGTWLRVANSGFDLNILVRYRLCAPTWARWSPLGYPMEPHIAKSFEHSDDYRVWTVKLRKGLKWSDGHPYTADDVMFYWEHEANNDMVMGAPPEWMFSKGVPGTIEKVNDYELRFTFEHPYPLFVEGVCRQIDLCDRPAHYLKQYHPDPKVGDPEVIAREMKAYGSASPLGLYNHIKDFLNPEHPRLWPWLYRTYRATPPQVFVRNPYYHVVDTEGNQLPYVDRVQFAELDSRMVPMTLADGGVSMQTRHTRFQDYTEMMSRREVRGTEIYHWYPATRSVYVINPNLNRYVDPKNPATKWKAQLLGDKRFRQALSMAIDRERIITAEYSGVGEPSQVSPGPMSPFYNEEAAKAYTQLDRDRANELLDELGLTERDYEGYRTFPDGTRMTFFLDTTDFTGIGPAEFVVDDWSKVDVRVIARQRSRALFYTEKDGRVFDFNVWTGESDFVPLLSPRYFIPLNTESFYAVGWGKWYRRGGFYGAPEAVGRGSLPVPKDHPMFEAINAYEMARSVGEFEQQKYWIDRMLGIASENVWVINIATAPPQLVVVKKGFKNVPENALYGSYVSTPNNAGPELYYFENPSDSAGAIAEVKHSIIHPTLRPGAPVVVKEGEESELKWVGPTLRWMFTIAGLLVVGLVSVRHPFVGKRLLIMVPTLFIISVIVFTVIQLPPGDYLATRIIQLQESGDPSDLQTIEDLKKQFRYEDPMIARYLDWMGFWWFFTFEEADMGLLQGDLGRSMETTQRVNDRVGDRLLLTFLISFGTIMMTWMIAIPIGIYSAVRQYSIGDYVLTFLGFIGMCVPAFLLALVLIAVSDQRGLFSDEYAAMPEWTWGKFVDLLKHIWIPIVVLGVGGTAALIRIMRANLLDELRKPYVVTARAKGVKPGKLLMKYPVRIAINPFVSGIGYLFPQLVSGGAIVAMVLSLPTVGPMLLTALLTEDMYLAGSMLVLLSMLGVIGTLVSDLLLLWLDPRIRLEGGSR